MTWGWCMRCRRITYVYRYPDLKVFAVWLNGMEAGLCAADGGELQDDDG